jgi:hypothetical protein
MEEFYAEGPAIPGLKGETWGTRQLGYEVSETEP